MPMRWQEMAYRAQLHEQLAAILAVHREQGWEFVAWSRSRTGMVVRFRRPVAADQCVA